MNSKHIIFESDKCKIGVDDEGDIAVKCDDDESLVLGNMDIKMINGISDLAKRAMKE